MIATYNPLRDVLEVIGTVVVPYIFLNHRIRLLVNSGIVR
jgi:hypothetical protein